MCGTTRPRIFQPTFVIVSFRVGRSFSRWIISATCNSIHCPKLLHSHTEGFRMKINFHSCIAVRAAHGDEMNERRSYDRGTTAFSWLPTRYSTFSFCFFFVQTTQQIRYHVFGEQCQRMHIFEHVQCDQWIRSGRNESRKQFVWEKRWGENLSHKQQKRKIQNVSIFV